MTRRVSAGPKNTYLRVSGSGFRSSLGGSSIDGTGGAADGLKISGLGCH